MFSAICSWFRQIPSAKDMSASSNTWPALRAVQDRLYMCACMHACMCIQSKSAGVSNEPFVVYSKMLD